MQSKWQACLQKLINPPIWVHVVTYCTAVLSAAGSLLLLLVDYEKAWFSVLVYTLFGIAALSLGYAVYLTVRYAGKAKRAVISFLERHDFTYLLLRNYGFRTIILLIVSFMMSLIISVFNAYLGITLRSIWYGALAAYYIFLALMRGGILVHHQRKIGKRNRQEEREMEGKQISTYRNCGWVLLILNATLSSAIAQMIFDDRHFTYAGWIIYAYAAYAFYKITMSIINLVRATKQDDLTVQAIRNINLIDATVSILALQTALLTTFSGGNVDISLFNTLTGCVVSALAIGLSIFMIIKGSKLKKEWKKKEKERVGI